MISSPLPGYSGKPNALPDPDVLAQEIPEIVDDLEAALEQFREIANDLRGEGVETKKE